MILFLCPIHTTGHGSVSTSSGCSQREVDRWKRTKQNVNSGQGTWVTSCHCRVTAETLRSSNLICKTVTAPGSPQGRDPSHAAHDSLRTCRCNSSAQTSAAPMVLHQWPNRSPWDSGQHIPHQNAETRQEKSLAVERAVFRAPVTEQPGTSMSSQCPFPTSWSPQGSHDGNAVWKCHDNHYDGTGRIKT